MSPRIAIIGAGFGGLCMAIQLERAGITSYTVFEKAGEVGGTWRDNSYPGAGCDIPSHLYSFSFEKYASWTRRYPGQPEILGYLAHCADKYGVRGKIRFHTEVSAAVFDGDHWHLTTRPSGTADAPATQSTPPPNPGTSPPDGLRHDGPQADSPGNDGLRADIPGTERPGAGIPGADVPRDERPGADILGADIPEDEGPRADSPRVDGPQDDGPRDERSVLGVGGVRIEEFDVVVAGVGQLNRPLVPDIPGMADFEGVSFHSARWNHDHDLSGRRVAVIGTGSSAAQFIPPVAGRAGHLDVFQRTPNWVIPKPDAAFGPLTRLALHFVPGLQRAYREWIYRYAEGTLYPALARGWSEGLLRKRALGHLRAQVADPGLRAKLTPDYPPGCKRVVIDSRFYPALTRPNVDVVTDRIVRITAKGVETTRGLREADTIIYGTGFRSTEFLAPIAFTGRGGQRLDERWKQGAEAYLGISVPDFPNLFLLYGPNTNLGHNSIIFMIECQVNHIMNCLPYLSDRGPMEVRPEAMTAWSRQLDVAMSRMVWGNGCRSWYKTSEGRVTNNWPGPTPLYRKLTALPPLPAYRFG
ncbi:flavin-containing monooxygenase [Nonomuraea sp. NPDC059007]|uniref:flavin-containing monooxygenase n=1 Tax=Nonomuraea sp. NPDC059007 TaxID=3346692 RepID=UPI0036B340EB